MEVDRHNLLVVSDLHLGGPIRPPVGFKVLRLVAKLDREVCRFLDYQRRRCLLGEGGEPLPWTLVLNGDTIDFLHFDLRPEDLDDEEHLYGLEFSEARSRWKLAAIAKYHRRALRGLARFADAGHRLVFVVGNHDADLWFPGVRADLVDHIASFSKDPEALRERVSFSPWFYFEEGRAYIEHGHRFDPYATFPDPLAPFEHGGRRLAPNFGHWALRFFCNRVPEFPVHDVDTWGVSDFVRWGARLRGVRLLRAALEYVFFIWRYASAAALDRLKRSRDEGRRERRRARLRSFAAFYRMPIQRVRALDGLMRPHVGASVGRLAQALYFDRMLLGVVVATGLLASYSIVSNTWSTLASLGVLAAGVFAWWRLSLTRPPADIHPFMAAIARRVARLTGARVVVFGHTHRPVLQQAGHRAQFVNPGSWEHLPRQQLHADGVPCNCHARFAVITGRDDKTSARLMRWCRRLEAPIRIAGPPENER